MLRPGQQHMKNLTYDIDHMLKDPVGYRVKFNILDTTTNGEGAMHNPKRSKSRTTLVVSLIALAGVAAFALQ